MIPLDDDGGGGPRRSKIRDKTRKVKKEPGEESFWVREKKRSGELERFKNKKIVLQDKNIKFIRDHMTNHLILT